MFFTVSSTNVPRSHPAVPLLLYLLEPIASIPQNLGSFGPLSETATLLPPGNACLRASVSSAAVLGPDEAFSL